MANPELEYRSPATRGDLERAADRASHDWKNLWLRIRTISPRSLVRTLLVVFALGFVLWATVRAGSQLAPFWVGLVIAYVTAPLVKALDSFLPRTIAVLLVLVMELAILLIFLAILVPTLATEVGSLIRNFPSADLVRARADQAMSRLDMLPPAVQEFVRGWLETGYENLQANFGQILRRAIRWGLESSLVMLRSITFLLGFLVIPQWLVAVLTSQDRGRRGLDALLADWLRPDFWAALHIVDRTFAVYVRGRVIVAAAVALMTWVGLMLFPYLGLQTLPYVNALALTTFAFNLIPVIGPVLGAVLPLMLAVSISWEVFLLVLALVIGAQVLTGLFVTPRVENKAVNIHPALLAFVIVIASQFGVVWAVLAGPLAVALRDLFRYTYGRFSVPSRPAGLLPGAPLPAQPIAVQPMPTTIPPVVVERAMGD